MTRSATKNHSRVTPEGRRLGRVMATLSDRASARLVVDGEPDERCKSCAFTHGTVPNGCVQTQLDALKAVVERVPFLCHQANRKGWPCHGWYATVAVTPAPILQMLGPCPWEFSPPDEQEEKQL